MRILFAVSLLCAGSAAASVMEVPLALIADQADAIVIGVGQPARSRSELASLRIEKAFKGNVSGVISIADGDPNFICDTTSVKPGERALFLLAEHKGVFKIMTAGRGKLALSADSKSVMLDFFYRSKKLNSACLDDVCPLSAVLDELRPFFTSTRSATAFLVSDGVLLRTLPSRHMHCEEAAVAQVLRGCTDGGGAELSDFAFPLLCFEKEDGRSACIEWR